MIGITMWPRSEIVFGWLPDRVRTDAVRLAAQRLVLAVERVNNDVVLAPRERIAVAEVVFAVEFVVSAVELPLSIAIVSTLPPADFAAAVCEHVSGLPELSPWSDQRKRK